MAGMQAGLAEAGIVDSGGVRHVVPISAGGGGGGNFFVSVPPLLGLCRCGQAMIGDMECRASSMGMGMSGHRDGHGTTWRAGPFDFACEIR